MSDLDTPIMEKSNPVDIHPLAALSNARKVVLLALFCCAQFIDNFCVSGLLSATPVIANEVGLNNSQSVWLNGAYQLTFAALLLVSGRMSDIYNPKYVFLSGVIPLGSLALGTGFVRNKIVLIVLRALGGICASLTIPSSLNLLVNMFPDPVAQVNAVTAYGAASGLGNSGGLIIGAIFVSYASWPWIFWTVAIIAFLMATLGLFLIPNPRPDMHSVGAVKDSRTLDVVGVSLLTVSLVLFIFAVTSGSTDGWGKASVLVPLILSIILFIAFFEWEARIPEDNAALPPNMWRYKNFTILVLVSLIPFSWWNCVYVLYSWLWQEVYGWTAINTAVHFLPSCLTTFPVVGLAGVLQQKFPTKWVILSGFLITITGTVLLPFADSPSHYWRFTFPALLVGSAGNTIVYTSVSIALFIVTPPKVAGTVGAVFNCAIQLGAAISAAVVTSIQTSVQDSPTVYNGRAAGFWFLFTAVVLMTLGVLVFFRGVPVAERPKESSPTKEASNIVLPQKLAASL